MPRLNSTVIYFALFALLVFSPMQCRADINAQGAEHLKTMFTDMIEQQKATAALNSTSNLIFDGDVTVEQDETYYAITLPHIKIEYPKSGDFLELGIISINATPHSADKQWKMTIAMPTPVIMFDKDRNHIMRLNIGTQKATGIWNESLHNFAKLDATYKDITIESSDPGFTMGIPEIEVRYDLKKNEANRWSGPTYMVARDITLNDTEKKDSLKIKEIRARVDLDQYDPTILESYKQQIKALSESQTNADEMSAADSAQLASMIFDLVLKSGNGFKSDYSVSGLSAEFINKDKVPTTVNISNAHFGFDLEGFLDENAAMAIRLGYSDLATVPANKDYGDLFPANASFDIEIKALPIKDISELVQNTMQGAIAKPEMLGMAGISLMFKIPLMLSQSGTIIQVDDNYISNKDYKVTLNGKAKADINAVNSATATAQAKFWGLDKALSKTQILAADPDNKNAEAFRAISSNLELLKKLAVVESGPSGPYGAFVHIFNLVMDVQGKTLINDKTMQEALKPAEAE